MLILLQHIKNTIKNSITLTFIFITIISTLAACGGSSSDSNDDASKKKLEKITIEQVSENNVLEPNEALLNTALIFKAIGHYNDGSSANITSSVQWISNDPALASFVKPSQLQTHKIGQTNIVAKVNNITATWPISILEPIAITVSPSIKSATFDNNQMVYVPKGTSITLESIVEWSDHSKRDGANYVSWMEDDTSFAQDFSEKNRFRAVGNLGDITSLTASFHGVSSNTISLEVSDATLQKIIISSTTSSKNTPLISGVLYGTSRTFTAMGIYQDIDNNKVSKEIDITKDVEWTSSAPNIFYNINNSNIFTAYSGTANSKAIISAKMFNVESNQQELTIADATLSHIDIVAPNKSGKLINGIETTLSAVGYYLESNNSKSVTADLTSFMTWSSSDEKILKKIGHHTFLPAGDFVSASITANISDSAFSTSRKFNVNAGILKNITISEIHQYPLIVPLNKTRTFKAIGDYITDGSSNIISLDITNNVSWQLDQEQLPSSFVQARNLVLAASITDIPVHIYATSINKNKMTSNVETLTSTYVRKEFSVMGTTFSLSELMFDNNINNYVLEDGAMWGVGTWQQFNASCQQLGKRLATEYELNILQTAIDDLKEAYGWPVNTNYWTNTASETDKHISKKLTHSGESYTEEDTTFNLSACVTETN
ncbi:adhesion domain-containing protein [Photobacterium leiognathi subsp. mandapamensis]|uniref:adhesion domain-containing protein n=1 Tax=Photobacterium leiognathi TaxID=553611 RepID=UPI003BF5F50D